jgi:hypothetical protein
VLDSHFLRALFAAAKQERSPLSSISPRCISNMSPSNHWWKR